MTHQPRPRRKRQVARRSRREHGIIAALCGGCLLIVVALFGHDIRQIFYTASSSIRG